MTANKSTPQSPENQESIVNSALNLSRWKYFRSRLGIVLAASFDSHPLLNSPYFVEIDRSEYEQRSKDMQS